MNSSAEQTYAAIGLISGTLADGVDAALVRIGTGLLPEIMLIEFFFIDYPDDLRPRVLIACGEPGATTAEICSLHGMVGEAFAKTSLALLKAGNVAPNRVDFIGSHGQTVRHLPEGGKGSEGDSLNRSLE